MLADPAAPLTLDDTPPAWTPSPALIASLATLLRSLANQTSAAGLAEPAAPKNPLSSAEEIGSDYIQTIATRHE
jgi:hypothetical protein